MSRIQFKRAKVMKLILIFISTFAIVACNFTADFDFSEDYLTTSKTLEAELQYRSSGKIEYFLFTRRNRRFQQKLRFRNLKSLNKSRFDSSNPTRLIIHGWLSNGKDDVCTTIRDSFLAVRSYNVICVDWSSIANNIIYAFVAESVPYVGEQIALMLDFLHTSTGMLFEDLLLTGHSLGAHVAGFTGKYVTKGRVQKIIGLDPAYMMYSFLKPHERLSKNDAVYVEVIHTNAGILGFPDAIGTADFYPNGGELQPGCMDLIDPGCSHGRAHAFYAEAIVKNNFLSIRCPNWLTAMLKICGNKYSSVRMGSQTNDHKTKGVYYVPVNSNFPYGTG